MLHRFKFNEGCDHRPCEKEAGLCCANKGFEYSNAEHLPVYVV